jgi:hypothetical protein
LDTFELVKERFNTWLVNHGIAGMASPSTRDTRGINIPVVEAVEAYLKSNPNDRNHRDQLIAFAQRERASLGGTYPMNAEKWHEIQSK